MRPGSRRDHAAMAEIVIEVVAWLFIVGTILGIAAANVEYSDRTAAMTPVELADHEAELAEFFHNYPAPPR